ncbi:MAG TPA: putative toxin-antitoxin system toxin component, PIN family [Phycisphaerae bacterium]
MSRAPRVVLDTNVVLSAVVFAQGRMAGMRYAWQSGRCQPLVSQATASELVRALAYPKFGLSADEQSELLADYLPYCTTVRMPRKPPKTPACRDPFDVPFLQLAVVGKAAYLITGDRDLLALSTRFSCPILTADQWMGTLEKP